MGDLAWAAEPDEGPDQAAAEDSAEPGQDADSDSDSDGGTDTDSGEDDESPDQVSGGPAPDSGSPPESDAAKQPAADTPDSGADSDFADSDDSDSDDSDSDSGDDDDGDDRRRDRDGEGRRRDTADCFPGVDRDFGTTPCRATVSNGEETWTVRAIPQDDAPDRRLVVEFDGPGRRDPGNDPGCSGSANFDWTEPATSHWMFFTIGGGWDKEITATRKVNAGGARLARMARRQEICFVAPYSFPAWDGRRIVKADYDRRRDEYTGILPPCREVSYGDGNFPDSPCLDGRSYDGGRRTVTNRVLAPAHSQDPRPKNQTRRR